LSETNAVAGDHVKWWGWPGDVRAESLAALGCRDLGPVGGRRRFRSM